MILRLFTLILLLFITGNTNAQQIFFYFNDESVQVYNLDEVSRIDFDAENINLHLTDESLVSFNTDLLNYYRYFAESVTSIESSPARPDFRIFPNPTDNNLHLKMDLLKKSNLNVRVQSIQGVLMLEKTIQAKNQDDISLNLSGFASGQYICVINTGEYLITKSFVKR
jgi:hypothetical protein